MTSYVYPIYMQVQTAKMVTKKVTVPFLRINPGADKGLTVFHRFQC